MSEAHKRAKNIGARRYSILCSSISIADREAVAELDAKIRDVRRSANDKSNYYGAVFLYLTGAPEKARELIDKAQRNSGQNHMVSFSVDYVTRFSCESIGLATLPERLDRLDYWARHESGS